MEKIDRVCIVTGAGAGIGQAIAFRLAKDGASLIIADINIVQAKEVAREIETLGSRAMAAKTDAAKSGEVNQMVENTLKVFGRVDILVNNAGGSAREKKSFFHESTEDVWDHVLSVNLKGVLNCCRAVIGPMMKQRSGKIVNIASCSGMVGSAGMADYSAAKAGVIGFSMALAKELASYGINVNCVSPGPTATPGFLTTNPELVEQFKKMTGFGRLGQPEDVAHMVAFLVSDEANFISGQNFPVCGLRNLGW